MDTQAQRHSAAEVGAMEAFGDRALIAALENRLQAYRKLHQSLLACRESYIRSDLEGIVVSIQLQSACCDQIAAAERTIASQLANKPRARQQLTTETLASSRRRVADLLTESNPIQAEVSRLARSHRTMLDQLLRNNRVLQNLYVMTPVYGDPRSMNTRKALTTGEVTHV